VLNAIPFGPADGDRIRTFSEEVNRAFLPKPFGSRPVWAVHGDLSGAAFAAAFDGFRKHWKSSGQNLAAFALEEGQDPEAFYLATVWAAIRAGWREGYTLTVQGTAPGERMPLIPGLKIRPFEAGLNVARDIRLESGVDHDGILDLFAAE
jgi:hypothetical protein